MPHPLQLKIFTRVIHDGRNIAMPKGKSTEKRIDHHPAPVVILRLDPVTHFATVRKYQMDSRLRGNDDRMGVHD